jgi:hypothetical protein
MVPVDGTNLDLIHAQKLIEKIYNYQIKIVKRFIEEEVDIIIEGDDLVDSKGPIFFPKILR